MIGGPSGPRWSADLTIARMSLNTIQNPIMDHTTNTSSHNSAVRGPSRTTRVPWPPDWMRPSQVDAASHGSSGPTPAADEPSNGGDTPVASELAGKLLDFRLEPTSEFLEWVDCTESADGWENAEDLPEACSQCGGLVCWWTPNDVRRCARCRPPLTGLRLLRTAQRIRQRLGLPTPPAANDMLTGLERFANLPPRHLTVIKQQG